jgi:AraC family transcriptional regulator of adaptative response / DNA-3-methyladenine glycosylase II
MVVSELPVLDGFVCKLAFRPPYEWRSMLAFLQARGCAGIETVEDNCYHRTVLINDVSGWLSVAMDDENCNLVVTMSSSLAPKSMQVLSRVKRLFDLQANPYLIEMVLGDLAADHPGLRVAGAFDPFEIAIRAILGQVISVKSASRLAGKIAAKFGSKISTPFSSLNLHTPQPEALAKLKESELTELGVMPAVARTVIYFSRVYLTGKICLLGGADYEATVKTLVALPGIGPWTADYIAMRCLAWPDAFLHGDLGIKKALGQSKKKALLELTNKYRPWRAYATMHLWKKLEEKGA